MIVAEEEDQELNENDYEQWSELAHEDHETVWRAVDGDSKEVCVFRRFYNDGKDIVKDVEAKEGNQDPGGQWVHNDLKEALLNIIVAIKYVGVIVGHSNEVYEGHYVRGE